MFLYSIYINFYANEILTKILIVCLKFKANFKFFVKICKKVVCWEHGQKEERPMWWPEKEFAFLCQKLWMLHNCNFKFSMVTDATLNWIYFSFLE